MSPDEPDRDRKTPPSTPPAPSAPPRRSGRVQFDERGQAVWEWQLQTGMFDRNASTQKVRALTGVELQIEEGLPASGAAASSPAAARAPAPCSPNARALDEGTRAPVTAARAPAKAPPGIDRRELGGNPYDNAGPAAAPARRHDENPGFDPYSRGPARSPENLTFDPYRRTPPKR